MNKVLLCILLAAIFICLGFIIYLTMTPNPSARFTEFYLLNQNGKATDYPAKTTVDNSIEVIVGVINHEASPASYKVNIMSDGIIIKSIETGVLTNSQKLEKKIDFKLNRTGNNQRVEFFLFMDGGDRPHIKDPLVLIISVSGS